jgi:hypothetical protein
MTIFLYAGSGKKWRSHGGGRRCFASDRRWPCVCQLTLGVVNRGGGDGRVDVHATNAGVSVCRSVFGGLASARASDATPCLSIDRQTRLSRLSGARERSGPRLSRDRRWSGFASDASDAGSRTLNFKRAVDTWRRLRATDARSRMSPLKSAQ